MSASEDFSVDDTIMPFIAHDIYQIDAGDIYILHSSSKQDRGTIMLQARILIERFLIMLSCVLFSGYLHAQPAAELDAKYHAGYYAHESNNEKVAKDSGHNHYIKYYPGNRIIRLYVPYPYANKVKPATIDAAFDAAAAKSSGSAFIRDKFGALKQAAVAHLDTYRWIDGKAMYDCGNAAPCEVSFSDDHITIIQPGVVMNHKVIYKRVKIE